MTYEDMTTYEIRFNTTMAQRLALTGWQMTSTGARYDYWHKRNWTCKVPRNKALPVRFWRERAVQS
jgi:hypothetical protein